jgi:hypothetical protein
MTTLLITFGCSWTFGVGAGYQPGETEQKLREHCYDRRLADTLSWRGVLCRRLGWRNLNYAGGGSSNQRQFRLAETVFNADGIKKLLSRFDKTIVLWGITSTARNELYSIEHRRPYNFFYGRGEPLAEKFSECLVKYSYDHAYEVFELARRMRHWNQFFAQLGVRNYWFDTFNTHQYEDCLDFLQPWHERPTVQKKDYQELSGPDWPEYDDFAAAQYDAKELIKQEIESTWPDHVGHMALLESYSTKLERLIDADKDPRDIMTQLALAQGFQLTNPDAGYFRSVWRNSNPTTDFLISKGLCNPHSLHPTKLGHELIADYFTTKIQ